MDESQSSQPQDSNPPYNKKVHGNRFSVAHKLAIRALKDSGMSEQEAVPITGTSRSTIMRIWNDPELDDLAPQVVNKVKSGLGGLFYKRALGSLLELTPEKMRKSSALQLATTAGIMVDKGRLMEGLSTENVSFRGVAESLESDRAKIMARLESVGE